MEKEQKKKDVMVEEGKEGQANLKNKEEKKSLARSSGR